jgi:adenine-specific DNA-methyltransferase
VFVQINSENSHLVRALLDEVFGSENFVADIVFRKKNLPLGARLLETMHDQILFYSKNIECVKYRQLYEFAEDVTVHWRYAQLPSDEVFDITPAQFGSKDHPPGTRYFRLFALIAPSYSANTDFPYRFRDCDFPPPSKGSWVVGKEKLDRLAEVGRIQQEGKSLVYRLYHEDFPYRKITGLWEHVGVSYEKIYAVQTSTQVIERCLLMTTDPGDLVLDPTCGSGTSAYVAEQWGRRWITIDTSRVALTLARTRLMAARFRYYLLADSPEGRKKEAELTGSPTPAGTGAAGGDIRRGFVYERVPHVTLKSIANNEEIDAIHAKWQEQLEPLLTELNKPLKTKWREWEVPRRIQDIQDDGSVPDRDLKETRKVQGLMKEWWELRQTQQKEIDESIARHADTEILYDRPYEDKKTVRVTGPFTVESLSPHRTISVEEKKALAGKPNDLGFTTKFLAGSSFSNMVLDNLRSAGVQNTVKNERLKFDTLTVFPGQWINGVGEYADKDSKVRRAAICIGPEHGTVGPELVKEAAKEAVQGVGFDVLIVCGFAFDPHVSEEAKRYGKLVVLACRMNPDLAMGDLLKKTGAGNLFMVFGEPDIVIHRVGGAGKAVAKEKGRAAGGAKAGKGRAADGDGGEEIVVEVRGLDVYDPTTGEIRNSSTDDIACWFIDTNYSGEAFFVRHAYFTGADEPYEKLKRALRADIDEAAWSALYSTRSRPFPRPETGKIAIKVINHYGDEVLEVYDIEA